MEIKNEAQYYAMYEIRKNKIAHQIEQLNRLNDSLQTNGLGFESEDENVDFLISYVNSLASIGKELQEVKLSIAEDKQNGI